MPDAALTTRRAALVALPLALAGAPARGQAPAAAMTIERLDAVVRRIDPEVQAAGGTWRFTAEGLAVTVVSDADADRMRIVIPVRPIDGLRPQELYRMMQANFDTALDARYAIAREILWSTFIHPLSPLDERQFLAGLGQAINLVRNYGTSYASGLLAFRGGDSGAAIDRELIERLLKRGAPI